MIFFLRLAKLLFGGVRYDTIWCHKHRAPQSSQFYITFIKVTRERFGKPSQVCCTEWFRHYCGTAAPEFYTFLICSRNCHWRFWQNDEWFGKMRTTIKYSFADSFAINLRYSDQISDFHPLHWKPNYVLKLDGLNNWQRR